MARELPDRLKGAKGLPDRKIQLRDGTVMSKSAWNSLRSGFAPDLVRITPGGAAKPKPRVSAKEAAKQTKRAAKDIKKGNKTDIFTRTEKMKKRDLTPAKQQTRINAANRAKGIYSSAERTPAQTRAIKTESRVRSELEWRKAQADAKRQQKEIKAAAKKSKPRGRGGRMGGMLGGGSLTSRTK
jgi:hypothetical protein